MPMISLTDHCTNRVLLNNSFNDDGFEFSYILPSDFYTEIGGGLFRGDDFPFGTGDGKSQGGWSAYARIGGDIGLNQSWRLGYYNLTGEAPVEELVMRITLHLLGILTFKLQI